MEPASCTELTAGWALLPKFCPPDGRREPLEVVPLRFPWGSGSRPAASPAGPGLRGLLVTGLRGSYVSDNTSRVAPSKWPQRHLLQAPGLQLRWGGTVSLPALPSPSAPGTTFHTLLSHQQELWVTVTWPQCQKAMGPGSTQTGEYHVHHRPHLPMTLRALVTWDIQAGFQMDLLQP